MSGHSHWAGIKYKKAIVDAKRGKLFSKLAKNIMNAARVGGARPDSNLDLSYAIQRAKDANMTNDSIDRAIKKGTGDLPGVSLDWIVYEGYAPEGVAVMVQVLTDSKNRTVAEIRYIFDKHNSNFGAQGCVAWMFEKKGFITIASEGVDEEALFLAALNAGADDVVSSGSIYEIYCPAESLSKVRSGIEEAGFVVASSEISHIPTTTVAVDEKGAGKVLSLMNALEEHDDVQNIFANFEIDEKLLEQFA